MKAKLDLDGLEEFMKDFRENVRTHGEIVFPIEVNNVEYKGSSNRRGEEIGSWVSIRPCDGDKTYLGVYLGDLNLSPLMSFHLKTKVMTISSHTNPAIYVPDLKRVVWGMESWWGIITKPEQLKVITDADIQNVWYVKALIELGEATVKAEEE